MDETINTNCSPLSSASCCMDLCLLRRETLSLHKKALEALLFGIFIPQCRCYTSRCLKTLIWHIRLNCSNHNNQLSGSYKFTSFGFNLIDESMLIYTSDGRTKWTFCFLESSVITLTSSSELLSSFFRKFAFLRFFLNCKDILITLKLFLGNK